MEKKKLSKKNFSMSGFKLYNLKRQAIVEYRRIRIYKKIMEQKKVEKNYKILEKIQNKNTDYIYIYINFATIICYDVFNDMGC